MHRFGTQIWKRLVYNLNEVKQSREEKDSWYWRCQWRGWRREWRCYRWQIPPSVVLLLSKVFDFISFSLFLLPSRIVDILFTLIQEREKKALNFLLWNNHNHLKLLRFYMPDRTRNSIFNRNQIQRTVWIIWSYKQVQYGSLDLAV